MISYGSHRFPGKLFVVEGTDGSGKSTQLALLYQWLKAEGYPVFYSEWNSSPLVKDTTRRAKKRHIFTPATFSLLHATDFADRTERTLMSAGAVLHGYHIAHESHHKHSLYLIKNSELTGFSEAERAVIANVARYHRGSPPKERHLEYTALNTPDRETVCRLGAIVRLADALDRSYDGRVSELRCTRIGDVMQIQIRSLVECENELREAELKKEMFEQAFQCAVNFSVRNTKAKRA